MLLDKSMYKQTVINPDSGMLALQRSKIKPGSPLPTSHNRTSAAGAWFRSLAWELRFCMPRSMAKKIGDMEEP